MRGVFRSTGEQKTPRIGAACHDRRMTEPLTRTAASDAVAGLGWRYLLGTFCAYVPVATPQEALEVCAAAVGACDGEADEHLRIDIRPGRVELAVHTAATATVTARDAQLVRDITAALAGLDLEPRGAVSGHAGRSVQLLEIGIDALDIPSVRPFWKAVLGYMDEPGRSGPEDPLVDPQRQGPAVWFQQMDAPRPQRNRIHFDLAVPHDEAEARIAAALDAGGALVSDADARAFWVLADAEGNEVCICTWQDRDDPSTRRGATAPG
jgi:4a-hydroxytetrahydrobiopterin dehydratase